MQYGGGVGTKPIEQRCTSRLIRAVSTWQKPCTSKLLYPASSAASSSTDHQDQPSDWSNRPPVGLQVRRDNLDSGKVVRPGRESALDGSRTATPFWPNCWKIESTLQDDRLNENDHHSLHGAQQALRNIHFEAEASKSSPPSTPAVFSLALLSRWKWSLDRPASD
jgi:hypothetical protein